MTLTTAAVMLPNIRPIINIAIVSLTRVDTIKTANKTRKLPKLAAITILHFEINKAVTEALRKPAPKKTKATPRLAPELIPRTKGPASGFLNNVCISNPEILNPDPTKIAVNAFGNL